MKNHQRLVTSYNLFILLHRSLNSGRGSMCSKVALASIPEKEPDRIFVKDALADVPHLLLCDVVHNLYFPTRTGSTDYCVFAAQYIRVSRDV